MAVDCHLELMWWTRLLFRPAAQVERELAGGGTCKAALVCPVVERRFDPVRNGNGVDAATLASHDVTNQTALESSVANKS